MQIYAKSRLNKNIYDKMNKGADAIEIHLDSDYLEEYKCASLELKKSVPIRVVHAPLFEGCDTPIENMAGREALRNACEIASDIARIQNHSIIVVCHLETHPDLLKKLGVYDTIVNYIKWIVDAYPNIEIAIENVHHFKLYKNELRFREVNGLASIILAKDINHPRVGTCLDICHALMESRFAKNVVEYLDGIDVNYAESELGNGLSSYFKANKDTIKLIHLATAKTHGCKYDHGLPFEEDDQILLKGILDLYDMYKYDVPITIEVKEELYSNGINFEKTNKLLRKLIKEKE